MGFLLPTAPVAVAGAVGVGVGVAESKINVVPDILVTGDGSSLDGLAATLMRKLNPS